MCHRVVIAALAILFTADSALAAWVWGVDSGLELRGGYDSNLRLNETDELNTPLRRIELDSTLEGRTERTSVTLSGNWTDFDYPDLGAELDPDFGATIGLQHSLETMGFGFGAGRQRINTLATVLDDAGLLEVGVQRELDFVSANAGWQTSPRWSLGWTGGYQEARYLEGQNFSDYRFFNNELSASFQSGETTSWQFVVDQSEFETFDDLNRSRTTGIAIGLSRIPSDTVAWSLSAGRNRTETRSAFFFGPFIIPIESEEEDWRLDGSYRKRWETTDLVLTGGQSVQPAGNGVLSTRRYVSMTLRRRLTERLSFRLGALMRTFDEVNDFGGQENDRDAARYSASLDYEFSPRWDLRLEASHRTQAFDLRDDEARGNRIYVSVIFRTDGGAR